MLKPKNAPAMLAWVALLLLMSGCKTSTELTQTPAQMLFFEAESLENQGLLSDAITHYEELARENPGTRLATFAYLRIAELQMKPELAKWKEADTNYRHFLALNPQSHLTPFVLYRLLQANHEDSFTGLIFKSREVDRDMKPNRDIILEYKRFRLLYPKSPYLEEGTPIYHTAVNALAESEAMVGNYYFDNEQYNAAIGRYQHLLRTYPDHPTARDVLRRLIEAYRRNSEPDHAEEMIRIEAILFGDSRQGLAPGTDSARTGGLAPAGEQGRS